MDDKCSAKGSGDGGSVLFKKIACDPHRRDFVCGWGAACIETCVMFPLTKLIFRQQLEGLLVKEALNQLRSEGAALLYRGLLPPLIMKTTSRAVMFGMYNEYKRLLGCHGPTFTAKHALAAFLSGSTEALLCPFERVQTLLQAPAYQDQMRNTANAMSVVRPYGIREFYRGLTPIILRNGLSNILFFALRGPLRDRFGGKVASGGGEGGGTERTSTSSSTVANTSSASTSCPSCSAGKAPSASTSCSLCSAISSLSGSDSPSSSSLLSVSPSMRGFVADFLSGAVLGATISTVFFPLNVVKARMMSTLGTEFVSMRHTIVVIWRERNRSLKELYRGVNLNFSRSLLSWGITNAMFEFFQRLLKTEGDCDR
uniref:Solute carrier family 25 member 51 n=1 Tax=Plectus sambesii TaxID=2011161 RepID=A0A914X6V3_9BILA